MVSTRKQRLCLAQDADADALLSRDPLALLVGMVLDQQIPLEKAFTSPYVLTQRLGHDLDAREIAAYDPEALVALFSTPPALHRFPGSMAGRVQELCRVLVESYDGDAARVWDTKDPKDLLTRIKALPGFGEQKAKIFMALLGKQLGIRPRGWREVCAPYGADKSRMSVADITDARSLQAVRAYKQEMKRAAKANAE
ncbi:MAG TPA: HhH-GPD-type base excision DNA repair protein [Frankiaceae bacterium]|nr:HhH-GPD-type base excision DNA repair protein [Frankiaceae bacterium]